MSVYNDMASDAGYRYGSKENEQMARLIEQEEEEKQHQREMEALADAEAQAQQAEYDAMQQAEAEAMAYKNGGPHDR